MTLLYSLLIEVILSPVIVLRIIHLHQSLTELFWFEQSVGKVGLIVADTDFSYWQFAVILANDVHSSSRYYRYPRNDVPFGWSFVDIEIHVDSVYHHCKQHLEAIQYWIFSGSTYLSMMVSIFTDGSLGLVRKSAQSLVWSWLPLISKVSRTYPCPEFRIIFFNNRIFITEEFEEVWFIRLAFSSQMWSFQIVLLICSTLRVKTVISNLPEGLSDVSSLT